MMIKPVIKDLMASFIKSRVFIPSLVICVHVNRNHVTCIHVTKVRSLWKVRYFQKKIGFIYRPKQICHFTILNSFEFSGVLMLHITMFFGCKFKICTLLRSNCWLWPNIKFMNCQKYFFLSSWISNIQVQDSDLAYCLSPIEFPKKSDL